MNKNLAIICGVWNENTEKNIKKYLDYCDDYDVIISSDKHRETELISEQISVPLGDHYSYKCLEWAQQVKSEREIKNLRSYEDCFFIDANGKHNIELPDEYMKSAPKSIVCFDGYKNTNIVLKDIGPFNIILISSEFWYAKSIDFDFISKIWKSGYLKLKLNVLPNKYARDYIGLRLYFYCRSYHFNFIYGNEIIEDSNFYENDYLLNERTDNKIKVAICLSGEVRSWELTGKLWNNYHNHTLVKHPKTKEEYEIEYDFFVSSWDCVEQDDIKNNLKNLRGSEFLEPNSPAIYKNQNLSRMTYLNQRCNLLKTKYENDNDFSYDLVIQTRPDCVLELDFALNGIVLLYANKQKGYKTEYNDYVLYFSPTHNGAPRPLNEFWKSDDCFVVGNSNVIDVYSLLYKYAYLNDNFNFISDTHILQPDFIRYFNIHCIESDIRDKSKVSFWNIVIRESVVNELIKVINKLGDCDLVHSNIQQFKNNTNSFRAYQTTLNANIVIPMAGHGSRFTEQGYTDSKPFIDVLGKPMIHQVIRNLAILYNKNYKFIFVCLKDDYEKYNFDDFKYVVKHDNIEIIVLDEITEGATQTILKAKEFINNEEPLWMMNCDQMISYSPHIQLPEIGANTSGKVLTDHLECDGGMLCFYGEGTDWSYAKVGDDGYVTEVAEKKQISNDATAGYYYWNKGSDFVKYAEQMIEHNDRTNGEFYLAPVYNWAIKDGKKFRISYVTKVFELGTPEYLDNYLHNDTHFSSGQKIEDVVKRLK